MNAAMLILSIIMVILALFLIAVVLLQSGKTAGLSGAIAGGADTFLSKNKAKTWDAKLAKATKWVAIAFLVLSLVLALLSSTLL
jgi:preprotein translocase subunit SecG